MKDRLQNDPYHILGISSGSSQAEIKRAYFRMIRHLYPDKDIQAFKIVLNAYEQLRASETKDKNDFGTSQDENPHFDPPDIRGRLVDLTSDLIDMEIYCALNELNE